MNLFGRIEAVLIEGDENKRRCAYGILIDNGHKVFISNGNDYAGGVCSVKFDLEDKRPDMIPRGNFISTHIYTLKGLASEGYILCALWEKWMLKQKRYPDLSEINRYYDPGDLSRAVYIRKQNDEEHGRKIIGTGWIRQIKHEDYLSLVLELDSRKCARLIITESRDELNSVAGRIARAGLTPVEMEPLRAYFAESIEDKVA